MEVRQSSCSSCRCEDDSCHFEQSRGDVVMMVASRRQHLLLIFVGCYVCCHQTCLGLARMLLQRLLMLPLLLLPLLLPPTTTTTATTADAYYCHSCCRYDSTYHQDEYSYEYEYQRECEDAKCWRWYSDEYRLRLLLLSLSPSLLRLDCLQSPTANP